MKGIEGGEIKKEKRKKQRKPHTLSEQDLNITYGGLDPLTDPA